MVDAYILNDCQGRPLYLAYGEYRRLISLCHFKIGWHSRLDQASLVLQFWRGYRLFQSTKKQSLIIDKINAAFNVPVRGFLLYDTSWYKETQWIGFVETDGQFFFVKIFSTPEELVFQAHQAHFAKQHFSGPFRIIPVHSQSQTIMISPLIVRMRECLPMDGALEKMIGQTEYALRHTAKPRNPGDIAPIGFHAVLTAFGYPDLWSTLQPWLHRQDQELPLIPVHGDFVPWNLFIDDNERIVLADYDRAGWHVPYYDAFHFIFQPSALKKRHKPVREILRSHSWFDPQRMQNWLVFYFLDQIHHDLGTHLHAHITHKHTKPVLEVKLRWLMEAIRDA